MGIENIKKLRKLIMAPISDCKKALVETGNDVEKAFNLLKQRKMEPIVKKTGVSIDEAFLRYKQCNGDIEKTMEKILYISKAPLAEETEYLPDMFKRDKDSVGIINSIFTYLTKETGTKEYYTFMALLPALKNNCQLVDYYGQEFIKIIMELLIKNNNLVHSDEYKRRISKVNEFDREVLIEDNDRNRCLLIETIMNAINEDEYDDVNKKYWTGNYNINKLFDDYIVACKHNTNENTVQCLKNFIYHGISAATIFIKLADNLENKEQIVSILAEMGVKEWGEIPDRFSQLLMEVKEAFKIRCRSHVISQFILVVHPLCGENARKSSISFSCFSYNGACFDWPWNSPGSTDTLVKDKIISLREAKIFEKLGNLLICEENFNSSKIRELYDEFFQGKDPFNVIYTLPE